MKDITIESGMQALTPFSPQKKGGVEGAQGSFILLTLTTSQKVNLLRCAASSVIAAYQ